MQNYIVLEITRNAQGNLAVYPTAREEEQAAWKKYHQILTTAADSATPLHGAVIMGADGHFIERKTYEHPVPEPEPTPEPEENTESGE